MTSDAAGFTDEGSMQIVIQTEKSQSQLARKHYNKLKSIALDDENALYKIMTFEILSKWTRCRKAFKYSSNWLSNFTHEDNSRSLVFKYMQRWKQYIPKQNTIKKNLPFLKIQDQCIKANLKLKISFNFLQETNSTKNLIIIKNDIMNKKIITMKKAALVQLTQIASKRLRIAFSTWKFKTYETMIKLQDMILIEMNEKQKILPDKLMIVKSEFNKQIQISEQLKDNLQKNSELDQQVATIVREINIMRLKLAQKCYDYDSLMIENERLKEEIFLRHKLQLNSKDSNHKSEYRCEEGNDCMFASI